MPEDLSHFHLPDDLIAALEPFEGLQVSFQLPQADMEPLSGIGRLDLVRTHAGTRAEIRVYHRCSPPQTTDSTALRLPPLFATGFSTPPGLLKGMAARFHPDGMTPLGLAALGPRLL